jgi:hypothetical protein
MQFRPWPRKDQFEDTFGLSVRVPVFKNIDLQASFLESVLSLHEAFGNKDPGGDICSSRFASRAEKEERNQRRRCLSVRSSSDVHEKSHSFKTRERERREREEREEREKREREESIKLRFQPMFVTHTKSRSIDRSSNARFYYSFTGNTNFLFRVPVSRLPSTFM